jgi:zinc protease
MMRTLRRSVPAALLGLALWTGGASAARPLAAPVVRTLPNGLRVAVFADSSLPVVQMQLLVRAGSREDPAGKSGAANLLALMLGQGTSSRAGEQFNAEFERMGSSFSAAATRDFTTAGCSALAREFGATLKLLAEAVTHPALEPGGIERQRAQLLAAASEAQLNPALNADAHVWAMALAPHPYGLPIAGTAESIPALAAADLEGFYRAHYRPDNATLAIAGEVDLEAAFSAAADAFGAWQAEARTRLDAPAPMGLDTILVRVVDATASPRAQLRLGHPGPARGEPDYFPMLVANYLLAGTVLGGSHAAGGGIPADARSTLAHLRDTGLFYLSASCPPEQAAAVVGALRDAIRGFRAKPPAAADLDRVTRTLAQGYPLQLETRGQRVSQWLSADFYGLPPDYLARWPEQVRAVTAAQVHAAARKRLDPDHFVLVAVGSGGALTRALEGIGPVEVRDMLAAPSPPSRLLQPAAGAPSEQEREARAAMARAIAAHGGEQALRGVNTVDTEGRIVLVGPGGGLSGRIHEVRKDPFRRWVSMEFRGFGVVRTVQGLKGREGWTLRGDTLSLADSSLVRSMRIGFLTDPVHLLLAASDPASRLSLLGTEDFYGRNAVVVAVDDPWGFARRYYLDAESHMLLGASQEEASRAGQRMTFTRRFREYRPVDGVQWPFFEELYGNGVLTRTITLDQAKLNPQISDGLFDAPTGGPKK